MHHNPYTPPKAPDDGDVPPNASRTDDAALVDPVVAYTADGNLDAHSVVGWLESHGVRSHAIEDKSGVSLWAFGTISQFHKPQVFVNKADLQRAGELLRQYERARNIRRSESHDSPPILSECEECGVSSEFPASKDGTTQNCPKCHAFMDVGSLAWPSDFDFGEAESDAEMSDTVEDAMDAASLLDKSGEWEEAIAAYREIAGRWPEHAAYVENCISEVQRKIDAAQ